MRRRNIQHLSLSLVVCLLAAGPAHAQRREKPQDRDLERLTVAKIPTDTPELVAYLRTQVPADDALAELRALREKLGAGAFREREDASKALAGKKWHAYVLLLNEGLTAGPPEARRRARECMDLIRQSGALREMSLLPVVARVLEKRRSVEAIDPLFALLPWIVDDDAAEEFWYTLDSLVRAKRSLPAVCVGGLNAPDTQRRAAAGFLIARYGDRVERSMAVRLLADPDAEVRLRTAQGFLGAADLRAIPPLIALLDGPSTFIAWQAEELLIWMSDGKAPKPVIGPGDAAGKKACREAWQSWWDSVRATHSLAHLAKKVEPPGLYLLSDLDRETKNPFCSQVVLGSDAPRYRWSIADGLYTCIEQFLPGDRLLTSEAIVDPKRPKSTALVSERELVGRRLWHSTLPPADSSIEVHPRVCRRVGGLYTVAGNRHFLALMDERGSVVWKNEYQIPTRPLPYHLPGVDPQMARPRRMPVADVRIPDLAESLLPIEVRDGVVACRVKLQRYFGVDVWSGKEVIEFDGYLSPETSISMRNGNTLSISEHERMHESTSSGRTVWKKPTRGYRSLSLVCPLLRLGFDSKAD